MADDFFGPPTDAAADVPAETQSDGAVTETKTGEQVANEGGNPVWYDTTYPGQTTNSAGTPTQDAYGLNILSAAETKNLTRNINPAFINSFVDPNTPTVQTVANAVNKTATAVTPGQSNLAGPPDTFIKDANGNWVENPKYPASTSAAPVATPLPTLTTNTQPTSTSAAPVSVYVDPNGVAFNPVTGVSYPVNSQGRQLLPENVALTQEQRLLINQYNYTPKNLSANAVDDPEKGPPTDYRKTVAEAARQNANSETPNPFLTNIDKAGAEIAKGEAGVATAKQTIQSAQQKITDSESIIAQNNTELANPDTTAERRAVLEANNAAQTQNIFDQTQSVTENQAYIANTQDTIQFNEATINENAAVYRDSTGPSNTTVVPINVDPNVTATQAAATAAVVNPTRTAVPVKAVGTPYDDEGNLNPGWTLDENRNPVYVGGGFIEQTTAAQAAFSKAETLRLQAQRQAVLAAQKKKANDEDWRVRLSLAPGANYLYNDPNTSILQPLRVTGGVIFPYTPKIEMSYKADYESYALTHSNYKGYFYKNSYVDTVNMSAVFTAQDTNEANYLLAVIHFFRSVTKMFYGQDKNPIAGAPPPLVFLTGLGQYQFANQPCVVTAFNYNLPNDIDYIRAGSLNINGTNMLTRRDKQDLPTNPISGAVARLQNLWSSQGIMPGASRFSPLVPSLSQNQPTYVPTRLEFSISLLPVQTRRQMSRQFSLQGYASGALAGGKYDSSRSGPFIGGFW